MQPAQRFLSAIALTLLSATAFASTTVYTSSGAFLPQVAAGSYTENFDTVGTVPFGPVQFTAGSFSYTASAPSDLFTNLGFLGANGDNEAMTITFDSGNVTAFGANFYVTNIASAFIPVAITMTLSDGTVESFTPSSATDSFRGFVSTSPITSLVITSPGLGRYVGLDNFVVGATPTVTVPEPTSLALVGLGVLGLYAARRLKA